MVLHKKNNGNRNMKKKNPKFLNTLKYLIILEKGLRSHKKWQGRTPREVVAVRFIAQIFGYLLLCRINPTATIWEKLIFTIMILSFIRKE